VDARGVVVETADLRQNVQTPLLGGVIQAKQLEAMLPGSPPVSRSLATVPALARELAARTWQLVRIPSPVLLTSDTPAVLWAPAAAAKPHQVGLGSAHDVRVSLTPATPSSSPAARPPGRSCATSATATRAR
jgi:hypothetical protein